MFFLKKGSFLFILLRLLMKTTSSFILLEKTNLDISVRFLQDPKRFKADVVDRNIPKHFLQQLQTLSPQLTENKDRTCFWQ